MRLHPQRGGHLLLYVDEGHQLIGKLAGSWHVANPFEEFEVLESGLGLPCRVVQCRALFQDPLEEGVCTLYLVYTV